MLRIQLSGADATLDVVGLSEGMARSLSRIWGAEPIPLVPGAGPSGRTGDAAAPRLRVTFREALDAPPGPARAEVNARNLSFHWFEGADGDRFVLAGGGAEVVLRPSGDDELRVTFSEADGCAFRLLAGCLDLAMVHAATVQGSVAVHAAAFEARGRSVIALGSSGSGKSTLALAAIGVGGRVVSDDTLLLSVNPEGLPSARYFRPDILLREGSLGIVPPDLGRALARWGTREGDGPGRWTLSRDRCPSIFVAETRPLILWLLSEPAGSVPRTTVEPLPQAEALAHAIAFSTPLFLARRFVAERKTILEVLPRLATGTRGYRVAVGRDLLTHPAAVIRRLLEAGAG